MTGIKVVFKNLLLYEMGSCWGTSPYTTIANMLAKKYNISYLPAVDVPAMDVSHVTIPAETAPIDRAAIIQTSIWPSTLLLHSIAPTVNSVVYQQ